MEEIDKKEAPITPTSGVPLKRLVIWFLGNIAIWVPAYYWLIEGNVYARNYSVFIVWVHFLCSLGAFSKDMREKLQKDGPSIKPTINLAVDCLYSLILATFGFYWLAGLYIVGSKFQQEAYTWDTI